MIKMDEKSALLSHVECYFLILWQQQFLDDGIKRYECLTSLLMTSVSLTYIPYRKKYIKI